MALSQFSPNEYRLLRLPAPIGKKSGRRVFMPEKGHNSLSEYHRRYRTANGACPMQALRYPSTLYGDDSAVSQ